VSESEGFHCFSSGVVSHIESRVATLLDGGQALVEDVGLQQLLQLTQSVGNPGHQVVHASQVWGGDGEEVEQ